MQLSINDKTQQLAFQNNSIKLQQAKSRKSQYVPLSKLQEIHINKDCYVSAKLLEKLLHSNIDIYLNCSKTDTVSINGMANHVLGARVKKASLGLLFNEHIGLNIAKTLVNHKIKLQQRCLKNMALVYGKPGTIEHRPLTSSASNGVYDAQTISQLLGIEGSSTRVYFGQLKHFFPTWAGFTARIKRPSPDPANALLSYTYVLFTKHITNSLVKKGFDPTIGALHQVLDYRPSLSCDVLELFRTQIDAWVIVMLHTSLSAEHFTNPDPQTGAVLLTNQGKAAFFPAYRVLEKRLSKRLNRILSLIRFRLLQGK